MPQLKQEIISCITVIWGLTSTTKEQKRKGMQKAFPKDILDLTGMSCFFPLKYKQQLKHGEKKLIPKI